MAITPSSVSIVDVARSCIQAKCVFHCCAVDPQNRFYPSPCAPFDKSALAARTIASRSLSRNPPTTVARASIVNDKLMISMRATNVVQAMEMFERLQKLEDEAETAFACGTFHQSDFGVRAHAVLATHRRGSPIRPDGTPGKGISGSGRRSPRTSTRPKVRRDHIAERRRRCGSRAPPGRPDRRRHRAIAARKLHHSDG